MTAAASKSTRATESIDDQIAKAAAKLKMLQDQKRATERQAIERNERSIAELLKTDKLNEVPIEKWKSAMPAIRLALGVQGAEATPPAAVGQAVPGAASA